jgi:hypothetical protein
MQNEKEIYHHYLCYKERDLVTKSHEIALFEACKYLEKNPDKNYCIVLVSPDPEILFSMTLTDEHKFLAFNYVEVKKKVKQGKPVDTSPDRQFIKDNLSAEQFALLEHFDIMSVRLSMPFDIEKPNLDKFRTTHN